MNVILEDEMKLLLRVVSIFDGCPWFSLVEWMDVNLALPERGRSLDKQRVCPFGPRAIGSPAQVVGVRCIRNISIAVSTFGVQFAIHRCK